MNVTNEHDVTENGIHYHLIPNKKHKTISVIAKFMAPLSRDIITKRALLPHVLQQGTASLPDRSSIQRKLDSLYGAVLSLDGSKKGDYHIISVRLEIANQKFIADEAAILDEALALLKEIMFHPKQQGNSFDKTTTERQKSILKQKIHALMDDKMSYANMRLIDEMCEEEAYQLHVQGYADDLEEITAENLYSYYEQMLKSDQLDIFVSGDFDTNDMLGKLKHQFKRDNRVIEQEKSTTDAVKKAGDPNTVIEQQQIQQAKLHLGYRTNCTFRDKDYDALQVFNGLFGGFPSSKLFMNVREKNSLAYYAASRIESHKGLMLVFSGIAPDDYEKAKKIIEEQMDAMKKGDFNEDNIADTKELIVNQLRETMDHPQGMVELMYQNTVAGTSRTPEELIENIKTVSKQEIVDVANKIELDTVYLLTSKGGVSDE
ncbi:EF-P 5-aminopentanol modification-associated protein YfmF [Virgibacillus siamensis]|uniref:EF-P 5-aminopentanol modification-associated protein YfmF n=1 Tax=Virgibacillus siamensis TaxID=480071 RepID=UPI0009875DE5|nr:pitrilysin family protein [Virgibacillus siamensis]